MDARVAKVINQTPTIDNGTCQYEHDDGFELSVCGATYQVQPTVVDLNGTTKPICQSHRHSVASSVLKEAYAQINRGKPNRDLLGKVLSHIIMNPADWQQSHWRGRCTREDSCGTSMCFAGWATQLEGFKWYVDPSEPDYVFDTVVLPSGVQMSCSTVARAALGLTEEQASSLFEGNNDLPRLIELVQEFVLEASEAD